MILIFSGTRSHHHNTQSIDYIYLIGLKKQISTFLNNATKHKASQEIPLIRLLFNFKSSNLLLLFAEIFCIYLYMA